MNVVIIAVVILIFHIVNTYFECHYVLNFLIAMIKTRRYQVTYRDVKPD